VLCFLGAWLAAWRVGTIGAPQMTAKLTANRSYKRC
jgi:hypothetical protein